MRVNNTLQYAINQHCRAAIKVTYSLETIKKKKIIKKCYLYSTQESLTF